MTIGELITELEVYRAEHGDVEVEVWDCYNDCPAAAVFLVESFCGLKVSISAQPETSTGEEGANP